MFTLWRVWVSQTIRERKIRWYTCLCFPQSDQIFHISLPATSEGQIVPTAFGLVWVRFWIRFLGLQYWSWWIMWPDTPKQCPCATSPLRVWHWHCFKLSPVLEFQNKFWQIKALRLCHEHYGSFTNYWAFSVYHPQTDGLVECFNKSRWFGSLCKMIAVIGIHG